MNKIVFCSVLLLFCVAACCALRAACCVLLAAPTAGVRVKINTTFNKHNSICNERLSCVDAAPFPHLYRETECKCDILLDVLLLCLAKARAGVNAMQRYTCAHAHVCN